MGLRENFLVNASYNQNGETPEKSSFPKYRWGLLLLGVALLSISCASFILAAPWIQSAGSVTVTPNQAYTGDLIEITLLGFPGDYPVPAGSITLGGANTPRWSPLQKGGLSVGANQVATLAPEVTRICAVRLSACKTLTVTSPGGRQSLAVASLATYNDHDLMTVIDWRRGDIHG